ncbi:hypothetical protein VTN31DRAFT_21 [Thermomyces dupontii]|uniref:uncharacterized protein n=1 Tax=Talaromyces thermophilus TaxID=28565 RepID=UPI0037427C14
MPPIPAARWRTLRAFQIYGANTGVGKTVVSTVLCKALSENEPARVGFLKPVSTGPLSDADDLHLKRFVKSNVLTECLFRFDEPVSPHLASRGKASTPADKEILVAVYNKLSAWASTGVRHALVETAGGVLSPGPSGSVQADLYRPLRLPVLLVADSRLGGISSTISAFESLTIRGCDVASALIFEDAYYRNHDYLQSYFRKKGIPLLVFQPPPPRQNHDDAEDVRLKDEEAMAEYYDRTMRQDELYQLLEHLERWEVEKISEIESMAERARETIWYPFTQHQGMEEKDIMVIESAYDDYFQTLSAGSTERGILQPTFDGSASWWTQGLGHGNPDLALTAAYTAGRYGHVMFAGTVHEPALSLAEILLRTVGNPRLKKVFYTDNGSTGMEVAVKMALRASCARYGWSAQEPIKILGLKGSYHGDTIGAMDCSEPSTFNKRVEWYRGRGYWFDFPQVGMKDGVWQVRYPEELQEALGTNIQFESLDAVFDLHARRESDVAEGYRTHIKKTLEELVRRQGVKFGALIMEPVILGAGGMLFADPLFQNSLATVIRENPDLFGFPNTTPGADSWSGLPVIFDEVFTGLYRLGRHTAASFIGINADISVHAKLLTGGLIPLAATLASQEIFDAFCGPEKSDALLHGHSYTAHPIGCKIAETSIRTMAEMDRSGFWAESKSSWSTALSSGSVASVWSRWSLDLVRDLSRADSVDSVFAIGSVLSITLRDQHGGGYTSTAARGLQSRLAQGMNGFNIHSRVLGNVLYLMASMTTKRETLREIEVLLRRALI